MSTRSLADARRQQWLFTHGGDMWNTRDLWHEAQEELADAYNYLLQLKQYDLALACLNLGDKTILRSLSDGGSDE